MLYPDFNELVTLKNLKFDFSPTSKRASHSSGLGSRNSPFRGQGLEFDSVREYVPGDDIRNIDWRVTARTGSPHLKIFKAEREQQVLLCVDMNATMRFGTRKTFKSVQAARAASLLGWWAIANQERISACLFGDVPGGIEFFPPTRTKRTFSTLLKRLSEPFVEEHQISLEDAFQAINRKAPSGSLVYVISDFMEITQDFQQQVSLNRLVKRCDVAFISINDQADKSLYPVGILDFCGNDHTQIRIDTGNRSGKIAYEKLWSENRNKLYEMKFAMKIPLIELTTESDIRQDLRKR